MAPSQDYWLLLTKTTVDLAQALNEDTLFLNGEEMNWCNCAKSSGHDQGSVLTYALPLVYYLQGVIDLALFPTLQHSE